MILVTNNVFETWSAITKKRKHYFKIKFKYISEKAQKTSGLNRQEFTVT